MSDRSPEVAPNALVRHRLKSAAQGTKRLEVSVPADDVALVKAVASALRQGGLPAAKLRDTLEPLVSLPQARTGHELLAFLRASPLRGADLVVERDRSRGRSADLE